MTNNNYETISLFSNHFNPFNRTGKFYISGDDVFNLIYSDSLQYIHYDAQRDIIISDCVDSSIYSL